MRADEAQQAHAVRAHLRHRVQQVARQLVDRRLGHEAQRLPELC